MKKFRITAFLIVLLVFFGVSAQADVCDVDSDGDVDRADIDLIFDARNTAATGPDDPRDADGNGTINVLDGRQCVRQCSLANCGPYIASALDTPGKAYGVAISGNYAYVADGTSGLAVIDISDPKNPVFAGAADTPEFAHFVVVSDNYAYVTDYSSGLQVIDISDPSNPVFAGAVDLPITTHGIAISDNYAYVAAGKGLHVIDISDPFNPVWVSDIGWLYASPEHVAISGNYAYLVTWNRGFFVIDISDPLNPVDVTRVYPIPSPWASHGVAISGNYAYVTENYAADGSSMGLMVIDISDPMNPTIAGYVETLGEEPKYVSVSGNYAYIANGNAGLTVIDIGDPVNPIVVGSVDTPGNAMCAVVSDNYAYVADYTSGLQVIDISGFD